jgi:hypothetical protein
MVSYYGGERLKKTGDGTIKKRGLNGLSLIRHDL